MKNVFFLILISLFSLVFNSCGKCNFKKPKGIKPIDWENYNDVYTVYWNYSESGDMSMNQGFTGDTIKVYGWIFQGNHGETINPGMFMLIENEKNIFDPNPWIEKRTGFYIETFDKELINALKVKFSETDITKKCYIIGSLISIDTGTIVYLFNMKENGKIKYNRFKKDKVLKYKFNEDLLKKLNSDKIYKDYFINKKPERDKFLASPRDIDTISDENFFLELDLKNDYHREDIQYAFDNALENYKLDYEFTPEHTKVILAF
jgi:hypothetical protein